MSDPTPNILGKAYPYPTPTQLGSHIWRVESDVIRQQVFQACSCGWKKRVRDFYGAACIYDTTYEWNEHLAYKSGD